MLKKSLAVGIILLFIVSTVTPLVIGYDVEIENKEFMDDMAFDCYDEYHPSQVSYYRERLLKNYSNDGDVELEECTIPVEIPATVRSEDPIDSPWPMKSHDLHHTGRSPYSTIDNDGAEKWRFKCDWVEGGPIIGNDGTIYFGSDDRYLYALNSDGALKWKYKTNDWIWSTPAIAEDGTIYIGTYGDYLYAINSDGTLKWSFCAWGSISSSPAIAEDGTIYFGTMKGFDKGDIYAVNPNGTEKWHYRTDYFIVSDPAIAEDGTIYIGSGDGYLYAMYPNGTLRWRFKTGDRIKSHPSIADDGTIYFDSFDGNLYALNPNGTLKWTHGGGCGCASASIGKDGTIYIGGFHLTAIYPNGTRKWRFTFGEQKNTNHVSPAISSDGTIYVGVSHDTSSGGGSIYAINKDGTERWRKRIANNWVVSSPCIGEDGTVYIGSSSDGGEYDYCGHLHAFGPQEGNNPPNKPNIGGKHKGAINTEYRFIIRYNGDPDNNPVSYYIDWGDGTNSGWKYDYASYYNHFYHTYKKIGLYIIRAKAGDDFGGESDWATLGISMPKNKIINPFERFLENHPNMFPLLRQLLGP